MRRFSLLPLLFSLLILGAVPICAGSLPHLATRHGAMQLIAEGKPFLMLGGELGNSAAADLKGLSGKWKTLAAMHLNTVLAPVYWERIEPEEGQFDFSSVDGLLAQARSHDMHLVLLWFGSWKNSMSSYAPGWVKADTKRFPRVITSKGAAQEILSPFSENNLNADIAAYRALMAHLKKLDVAHTVLMMQVENEVGMLPEARDHSPAAEAAFKAPVPGALTDYFATQRDHLRPFIRDRWIGHGAKRGADWSATFGPGVATDEISNAWYQAYYTGQVAAAGRAVYALPSYVNAAQNRPGRAPGAYPSGGPLAHLFDIWKAAAPAVDLLSPDVYFPDFADIAEKYTFPGNALLVPETGRVSAATMAVNALYAFGGLNAIGFSPFAIESFSPAEAKALAGGYGLIRSMAAQILAAQGTGNMAAFRPAVEGGFLDATPQRRVLGGVRFYLAPRPGAKMPGGLIIRTAPDTFLIAGTGLDVRFDVSGGGGSVGIRTLEKGHFSRGLWQPSGLLNGDQSNQGREVLLPFGEMGVQKLVLYRY